MGIDSCCCCSQSIGLLRDLYLGDYRSGAAGRHHLNGTDNSAKVRNAAVTCANSGTCVLRCHCGISQTHRNGKRHDSVQTEIESLFSQAGRPRWETGRTSSLGLLHDPILECRRCTVGNSAPNGVVMSSSSSSAENNSDVDRKALGTKLSIRTLAVAACFGGIAGVTTVLLSTLPPNFERRWRMLLDDVPQAEESRQGGPHSPTVLFDRHGVVIATIAAPGGYSCGEDGDAPPRTSGKSMSFSAVEISTWMWQAVIASEDRSFFTHHGIDPKGLSRAVLSLGARGGGSTITQQLVKNAILTSERKWTRKLSEIILAILLEKQMSKWDILHRYLKKIYWGHGVYGIEGASALYFAKHPSLLSLGECAMLAGIIPAPELLSPYRDPSRGKKPQGRALRRMVEAGFLDPASAAEVMRQPLQLAIESHEGTSGPWKAPYFVSEVLSELARTYGWPTVARGGLQVHTTLDLAMQTVAEETVLDHLVQYDNERILCSYEGLQKTQDGLQALQVERQEQMTKAAKAVIERGELGDLVSSFPAARKAADAVIERLVAAEECLLATASKHREEIKAAEQSRMEAAMVVIDPPSGAVRVLVGGRDYYESSFNRGTQLFRSPGSAFKPVVYLTALAEGFAPDHVLMDEPITIGGFTPENEDFKFRGQVTLEESLLYSLNVPTVRLCAEVGVEKLREMGRALGIETFLPDELTLSLGGCEVTPVQLATVYGTIAAGGVHHKPHFITRIESQDGQILEEHQPSKEEQLAPVVNESAVAELRRLLQAVVDKGTGRAARLGRPCAGLTGTSDGHRDVWFAGFTPEISCVVWLGYDDNAPLGGLNPDSSASPVTGASHAAPLWKEFMKAVHERVPVRKFHDVGCDKYGSRGPKQFVKRSRRATRIGLHKMRKSYPKRKKYTIPWKRVWDWEKASVAWAEQEKMNDWAALRMRRARITPHWASRLRSFLDDSRPLFAQT